MRLRAVTQTDRDLIAMHRYPDEADQAERPVYAAWVAGALARDRYLGFVAVNDGGGGEEVVAGAGLTLLDWGPSRGDPQPDRGRLVNVWTHPAVRRQGLARTLVTLCLDAARNRGITHLSLGTSPAARGLYTALGFEPSGTEMTLRR
ncbi:GNAT family N-acetyltransferase [Deinococcus hohokamensis]|uniref:GNAT family N-acetyltransferase n=1 Tax=Deinococcus hohokamensis TaxID=309883 RepID=A0ABV9I9L6_9DEIO